ncbi:MAG: DUF3298 domain-containing protein [Clostridiaceae bacterium]|nr:DUF3298 domain-containing protein [Clostridiaceae bacterium]
MKKLAMLLVLIFSMVVSGCSGFSLLSETEDDREDETEVSETFAPTTFISPTTLVAPTTSETTLETTEAPPTLPSTGDLVILEELFEDSYTDPDDGVVVFEGFVQSVSVELPGHEELAALMNEVLNLVRDESIASVGVTREDAISMYDEYGSEGMVGPNVWETTVVPAIISDRLVCFYVGHYMYYGGAHGGYYSEVYTFDIQTGDVLTLDSICEDKDAFETFIFEQIIAQIEAVPEGESMYFPEYSTSVEEAFSRATWEFFELEGVMTFYVTYQQYDLAAYAAGMPGFGIPLSDCVPYFNAYGQSLVEDIV